MKHTKKGLLLAVAFAMSMTLFAACGGTGDNSGSGDNGGNVQGEQLADAMAWAQAWNDSVSSTNATATFSFTIEDRQGALFEKEEANGTYKVADSKLYGLMTGRESWNNGDGDVGDEPHVEEWYVGAVNGAWYEWEKDIDTNEWLQEDFYVTEGMPAESYTTVYGILYELELPFEQFYTEYESFTYTDGVYVLTMTAGSFTRTASLKFAGGKLVSYEMIVLGSDGEYTSSGKMQVVFTYGNTTIGALPGQEGVEGDDSSEIIEESSEVVEESSEVIEESSEVIEDSSEVIEESSEVVEESSEIIEDSGEVGGDTSVGGDMELPDVDVEISEPLGEQVADQAEWDAVWEKSCKATNFIVIDECIGPDVDVRGVVYVADGKYFSKYTLTDGEMEYAFCGKVDGKDYGWMSSDGIDWTVEELEDLSNYVKGECILEEFFAANDFENAVFNENRGTYTIDMFSEEVTFFYEVKIANGCIVAIDRYYDQEKWCLTIEYGNAGIEELPPIENDGDIPAGGNQSDDNSGEDGGEVGGDEIVTPDVEVQLPETNFDFDTTLGDDIIGEEVTFEEMQKAIKKTCASNNFTIKGHSFIQGGASLYVSSVANEKSFNVTKATYLTTDGRVETTTMYMILGAVDGVDYAWASFDGEYWECALAEEVVLGGGTNGNEVFGMYLQAFTVMDSEFNATTGEYSIVADDTTIAIKIVDGSVKMIYMSSTSEADGSEMYMTYVIEYGNAVDFELPPIESGDEIVTPDVEIAIPEKFKMKIEPTDVVTQAEWEEAVRASAAATNFRVYCLYAGRYQSWQSIADGKGSHRVENADGSVMYSYAGAVDGSFYTWVSMDGENWACQQVEEVPLTGAAFFTADMVNLLAYGNAVYDEQRGVYTVTGTSMENEMIIEVIINDGKIVSINGVENLPGLYQLSYGDAYVGELPPVMENNNGGTGNNGNNDNNGTITDKDDNMTDDNGGAEKEEIENGNGMVTDDNAPQPSDKVVVDKVTDNG